MARLRMGVVGSGGMGGQRAESFNSLPNCEVVGIAARNPATGSELAEKLGAALSTDWKELIDREDVDAITICTHNEIHGAIILKALEAGKHVFTEYPIVRHIEEADRITALLEKTGPVLRVAHSESVSGTHHQLKAAVADLGELLAVFFQRLTPGRGARPEVLFNLNLTGPPALFFVYHVYAMVDLFGPAAWVDCGAKYQQLEANGSYNRFINAVTVGFERGGLGQWNWAGGINIQEAQESLTIVLEGGTLVRQQGNWTLSKSGEIENLKSNKTETTLEEQFLEDIHSGSEGWKNDTTVAIQAARIGMSAEQSSKLNQRIHLSP